MLNGISVGCFKLRMLPFWIQVISTFMEVFVCTEVNTKLIFFEKSKISNINDEQKISEKFPLAKVKSLLFVINAVSMENISRMNSKHGLYTEKSSLFNRLDGQMQKTIK